MKNLSALDLVLANEVFVAKKRQGQPVLNFLDPAQTEPLALANTLRVPPVSSVPSGEWMPTHPLLSYSFARSPVLRRVVRVAGAAGQPFVGLCFAHGSSGVEAECARGFEFRSWPGSLRS